MLSIKHINSEGIELNIVRELFREYEKELDENLCFQSFEAELADPLKKYGEPSGDILLAYWGNEIAGCVALSALKDGSCEMKRLYVKPGFRKNKIGQRLVEEISISAKERGYKSMKLDTLNKLKAAISLYENYGFRNITPYNASPLRGVVYMEKELAE